MSDACQNVMSYIAEAATYFQLPVVGHRMRTTSFDISSRL